MCVISTDDLVCEMVNKIEKLRKLHGEVLKFPLENFSLYARMRPPTLDETARDIAKGMGGDCNALSHYISAWLMEEGILSRVIYFDNDVPSIDETIDIDAAIDRKYHAAVEAMVAGVSYVVDVGLQFEEPIPLNGDAEYIFPTKILRVERRGDGAYTFVRVDSGDREIRLDFDLREEWDDADHVRVAWNNFYRDIKLKYGVLRNGKKLGMRVAGDMGTIIGKTMSGSEVLHRGGLESCAEYLGVNADIFRLGHENFTILRRAQRGASL